ncbi:MAG: hypothetical protein AAF950_16835 [Pseudomonadota bacterium]
MKLKSCLLAALTFVACASPTGNSNVETQRVSSADRSSAADIVQNSRTGLPPQSLRAGECGLFLWSQTEITQLVFFARAGESSASVFLDGAPTPLTLRSAKGDIFGQFLTDLEYTVSNAERALSVVYTPGEELEGGARISSGRISYIDAEGWTRVLPVLGVRACQPIVSSPLTP